MTRGNKDCGTTNWGMNWTELKALDQVEEIKKQSEKKPVLIFKHSTRCNISRASLDRLERNWNDFEMGEVRAYFLDLLTYRQISNFLAEVFGVVHQSPQILVIDKGKSVLDLSHFEIDYQLIKQHVRS